MTFDRPDASLAVTVLGSGGPMANPSRASAGYVVWVDGRPSLLVDAGGGTFERLGRAGIDPATMDAVALTHTHIDHTGGLAPVVFAAWMHGRTQPLRVIGPTGRGDQAGCGRFCDLLFGRDGAWSYLHTFDGFGIEVTEVDQEVGASPALAWEKFGMTLSAVGVPHGMMPSVAYRIDYAGRGIVISGDIDGSHPGLVELARGCDVLVHDQAMPRRDVEHGNLHSPPEQTAATATAAGAGTLVLSHFMPAIEAHLDDVVERIGADYRGRIVVASDLVTITVDGQVTSAEPG